jgi:hypothetical protein
MTRRDHYLWARRNYPDRTATSCWRLSLQLLELERSSPGGVLDEAMARQFVAAQTVAIAMAQAVKVISTAAGRLANSVIEAMRSMQNLATYVGERRRGASMVDERSGPNYSP